MGTTTTVVEVSSDSGGAWIQVLSIFFAAVAGVAAAFAVFQGRSRERDQRLQALAETIVNHGRKLTP